MGFFNNINTSFSRGRVATEGTRASANDGIKKSSGTSFDKSIRQLGSGLMQGLRNATACFNPAALSAKVHDFNPDAVAQSTAFARDTIKVQDQKLQERMTTAPQAKQAPRASVGSGAGRPRMSTFADRPNKASNAAPPQTPHASGMREQKRFNALSDDFVKHFNKVNAEMSAGESRPQVAPLGSGLAITHLLIARPDPVFKRGVEPKRKGVRKCLFFTSFEKSRLMPATNQNL